jgi:hypothetical protein
VENYMVPAGAKFGEDVQGTTPVDESKVKAETRKPLAQRRHGRGAQKHAIVKHTSVRHARAKHSTAKRVAAKKHARKRK